MANFLPPLPRSSIRVRPGSTLQPEAIRRKRRGRRLRRRSRFPMQMVKVVRRYPWELLLPCRGRRFLPGTARRVRRKRGRRACRRFRASRRYRRRNLNRSRQGRLKGLPMSGRPGRSIFPCSHCRLFSQRNPAQARRQAVCKTDRQHLRRPLSRHLERSLLQIRFPCRRPPRSLCRKPLRQKRMRRRMRRGLQRQRRDRRKMQPLCPGKDLPRLHCRARPRSRRLKCLPMDAGGRANCRASCAHRFLPCQG